MNKAPDAFRTISEVADELDLPQHVLRFWESRFPHIKPLKRGGGRRYYRPEDIDLLRGIRRLLYADGYTIRGVQRILREQGVRTVQMVGQGQDVPSLANLAQDGDEDGHSGNGGLAEVNFLDPRDGTAEEGSGGPATCAPPVRPKNGPMAEVGTTVIHPAAATPVAKRDAGPVDRSTVIIAPVAATPAVMTPATVAQVNIAPAHVAGAAPTVTMKPSPPNMAARDLERLKQALADLEACRRLLDKAIEGGQ